ncbi:MAG: efflux RND transporter permease subunit, partial [Spirochaetaceae bacterium]
MSDRRSAASAPRSSIPSLSVRHPVTTSMVFAALAVIGVISLTRIGQELFPDVNLPTMVVITVSPGAAPQEVESLITERIEDRVAGINGVRGITSTSEESSSTVVVSFSEDVDLNTAFMDLREAISAVENQFPDGTRRPLIFRFSASQTPSLEINIVSSAPGMDIRRIADDLILPAVRRVDGVGQATLFGGRIAAMMVEIDLDALDQTGIPLSQVLQSFGGENVTMPAGSVDVDGRSVSLRAVGSFQEEQDLRDVLVGFQGQVPILLRDVANIGLGFRPQEEIARSRDTEAVRLTIRKQPDANTVDVNDGVLAALDTVRPMLPPEVELEIQSNQADTVRASIGGVVDAGWQGGLLAIIVLLVFLRNVRSTLIVAATIPVAVIATMLLIDFAGMTLNITSLMGITLAIGMFVDNSIVVLESIYRKALAGLAPRDAAIEGAQEVSRAVTASTLTTMAVFLPMLFLEGLAGVLFQDLSLTISFSLFMSLAAALSFIPVLASRFLRVPPVASGGLDHEISLADVTVQTRSRMVNLVAAVIQRALVALDAGYERAVAWALRHRVTVVVSAVVLLGVSLASVLLLGAEFLPVADEGQFSISFRTREGASSDVTLEKFAQIERIIRDVAGDDIVALGGRIGGGIAGGTGTTAAGGISVTLTGVSDRRRSIWAITREVDRRIARDVLDVDHQITIVGMSSLAGMASGGGGSDLVIELSGRDLDRMRAHALELVEVMRDIPGTRGIRSSASEGTPELRFVVRRQDAASLGVSSREIATILRAAFNGVDAGTFSDGGGEYDIVVIAEPDDRVDPTRANTLFVVNPAGSRIMLQNLVDLVEDRGPVTIERSARTRVVRVLGDLDGTRPLSDVVSEIERRLAVVGPPPVGIDRSIEGLSAEMGTSFRSLALALALAVALVYMVMASQFEDFLRPLIVMGSVPFAVIGLVGALLVTNTTFSILAFAGGILLVGIVVNNAIVLIDYMDTLRGRGLALVDAVVLAGKTRLKPILMTSLTTMLGLLPMSLALGTGAELRYPIGRAVVGGLATSTLITLILIPVLYAIVESRRSIAG